LAQSPKWHAAFTSSQIFISFARNALYIVKSTRARACVFVCVYIHIYWLHRDCIWITVATK